MFISKRRLRSPAIRFGTLTSAAAVVASLLAGCTSEKSVSVVPPAESISGGDESALYVSVLEVPPPETVQPTQYFTGMVRPARTSDLSFGRSARIATIEVAEGATVEANAQLATLDQSTIEAKETGLREALEAAQNELAELNPSGEAASPEESQQRLEELRQQLNQLEAETQNTNNNQDVSRRIGSLERQLRLMDTSNRQQRIQELNRQISETEGELQQVEADQRGGVLTAPFAGTVTRIYKHEGALVSPAVPVMQLASQSEVVKVTVTNAIASTLELDDEVNLQTEEDTFKGRVRAVDAQLDTNTRTRTVSIDIIADSIDREFIAGEVVTAQFESGDPVTGFRLPVTSLNRGASGIWSVYIVENRDGVERLAERQVEIQHSAGSEVYVTGDLEAGDLVVRDGVHRLVPGQIVHISSTHVESEEAEEAEPVNDESSNAREEETE
ncbi:MAG: hypothetical protein CMJ46_08235 [Planctomyces sp.]|nr:hypothetical protein [Planctomyces sp.]